MDVISWLAERLGLVRQEDLNAEVHARFEQQKVALRLQEQCEDLIAERIDNLDEIMKANKRIAELEQIAAREDERAHNALARVDDLTGEIEYLRGQVTIYQQRLGLLPAQKEVREGPALKPMRIAREPFASVQAKVQSQRTEEYWKARAAAVDAGTTAVTEGQK